MAMSKQDYADLGRTNAQQRCDPEKLEAPHPFDHGAVSWQAKAYWGAFDDEMFRLGQAMKADQKLDSESQVGIDPNAFLVGFGLEAWPHGAAEHAKRLASDLAKGKGAPKRLERLERSLTRLYQRHVVRQALR